MNLQKTLDWCERGTVFSFYGLVYFLPISTALVEIFSTIIITTYFIKRGVMTVLESRRIDSQGIANPFAHKVKALFESFKAAPSPLNIPILIFIIINFLSCIFSQYPPLSFKALVFKVMEQVILYYSFLEYMKTKKQLQIFTGIYLVSSALIVSNGLVEYFKGKGFIHGNLLQSGRVMSSFNHPNDLGAYLIFVVIVALSFLIIWKSWKRESVNPSANGSRYFFASFTQVGIMALFLASLLCMGLTFSRGAWVGLLLGLLYLAFIQKRRFYIPVAVVLVFFIIFLPRLEKARNVSFISDNATQGEAILNPSNSSELQNILKESYWENVFSLVKKFHGEGRKGFWREAVGVIKQFPVLGTGLNTYTRVMEENKFNLKNYPHNCYLQIAAETGLLGLTAFLWIFFSLFYSGARNISLTRDPFLKAVLVGFLSGLFGFLCHSFVDTNFYPVQLGNWLWLSMAVIMATQRLVNESRSP